MLWVCKFGSRDDLRAGGVLLVLNHSPKWTTVIFLLLESILLFVC